MLRLAAAIKKHALSRGRLLCLGDIATLNAARGCAGRCVFCYARCYPGAPDPDTVLVYEELPALLRSELDSPRRKRPLPGFVLVGSASDAFLGGASVLRVTKACLEILLERGIGVSLTTRGDIPDEVIALLARHASRVQLTVAIVSLSESYTARWEPGTASPDARLFLVQRLQRVGLSPHVRIEPIIPFANDDSGELGALLSAVSGAGVDRAIVGFLQLRRGVAEQIEREGPVVQRRLVLGCFPSLESDGMFAAGRAEFDHLEPRLALASLTRLQRLGRERGIRLSACRCQNPGLPVGNCPIAPPEQYHPPREAEQGELFGEDDEPSGKGA